ncbi:DUF4325 domain-containing protein [Candidatus Azambacteria bacterium]|nr:DUF4325 domain-containing protein [Candidatus Azambacteria bacterium]
MIIELKKFGDVLISRPAGREAYLAMSAYLLKDVAKDERIIIDFSGIKVLTPSWADEVLIPLAKDYIVDFKNTSNLTVQETLKTLTEFSGLNLNSSTNY